MDKTEVLTARCWAFLLLDSGDLRKLESDIAVCKVSTPQTLHVFSADVD
jgi:hypothetical protein